MYKCPHCQQELERFVFYCVRCGNLIGKVQREGEMLAVWWIDRDGAPSEKFKLKTLKRNLRYAEVKSISAEHPSDNLQNIVFTLSDGQETRVPQSLLEFFDQAANDTEEWEV